MIPEPLVQVAAPAAWAGAALAAAGAVLAPLGVEVARRTAGPRAVFFARWGFSHVLGAVLVGLAAVLATGPFLGDDGALSGLVRAQAFFAGAAATALWQAQRLDPDRWRSAGFRRSDAHARATAGALVAYALVWPLLVGLSLAWPPVVQALGAEARPDGALVHAASLSGPALLGFAALALVAAPLLEEVLFRGYLQPLLVQNFSERGGVAITAILFAAVHGEHAFAPLLALGLLLGLVRLRTKSVPACVAVHAVHNATVLAAVLWLPGTRPLLGLE